MMFNLLFIFYVSADLVNVRGDCRLDPHPSVEYRCKVPDVNGYRVCNVSEPAGTMVDPVCRTPNYYSYSTLPIMHCYDGDNWNKIAKCVPECGKVTPSTVELAIGGVTAKRGELPWHAGIYRKTTNPYMQICGGSLISTHIVISAAHCFCEGKKLLPATKFAVAVGKIYRPWDDKMDDGQHSDVKQIHIPLRYRGAEGNFQEDIAVVIVTKEFQYQAHIRPVCLDFDENFENRQLFRGAIGKVAGWGLTSAKGTHASPILQVLDMPYVDVATCQSNSSDSFQDLITPDKICAGTLERDTALCQGDSGGGLVFEGNILGVKRYYIRGVVSSSATSDKGDSCNTNTYIAFTSITRQGHFIKPFWNEQDDFPCKDGGFISMVRYCDGTKDCLDGSDETNRCMYTTCSPNQFRCAYGACVDQGSICNEITDCADSSDEDDKMCSTVLAKNDDPKPIDDCVPFLEHGTYTTDVKNSNIAGYRTANIRTVTFNVTCDEGYGLVGKSSIKCYDGYWPDKFPSCVPVCKLEPDPTMEYRCLVYGDEVEYRDCNLHEPIGTIVRPQCREPDYYPTTALSFMRCIDGGHWKDRGAVKCSTTNAKLTMNKSSDCFKQKIITPECKWYSLVTQSYGG